MSSVRPAVFAGRFYPSGRDECLRALNAMIRPVEVGGTPLGCIVPHAGWVYSGATAALAINALTTANPETVVIFGAVHSPQRAAACVFDSGRWETPLGGLELDNELARRLVAHPMLAADAGAHRSEHSIEVQLPIIRRLLGDVRIVPIRVSVGPNAAEIGRICAREVAEIGRRAVFIGSTDLTHYGPAYGLESHGRGEAGIRWAKEVNDRRFVERIVALDAAGVIDEAIANGNACGAGAVAATIAASREAGADQYVELEHITSADRESEFRSSSGNSVGYESGVFIKQA